MNAEAFLDSNVLIYLLSSGDKAARVEELANAGGAISVQVLNEITNVCRKKLKMPWPEVEAFLRDVRELYPRAHSLTLESQELGVALASRHLLQPYDGQIVASALLAGCVTLWSEDMHDGLVVQDTHGSRMTIRNPFSSAT